VFHLIAVVRRGSASSLPGAWLRYPTVDAARVAAGAPIVFLVRLALEGAPAW